MVLTQQKLGIYSSLWQFQIGKLWQTWLNSGIWVDYFGQLHMACLTETAGWLCGWEYVDMERFVKIWDLPKSHGLTWAILGSPPFCFSFSETPWIFWVPSDLSRCWVSLCRCGTHKIHDETLGSTLYFPHFCPEDTSGCFFFSRPWKCPLFNVVQCFRIFLWTRHGDLVNLRASRTPETPAAPAEKKTPRRKQSDWQMQERVKELEAKNLGAWGTWLYCDWPKKYCLVAKHICWCICWWFVNWHIVYFWWPTWDDKCWHGWVRVTAKLPNMRRS